MCGMIIIFLKFYG